MTTNAIYLRTRRGVLSSMWRSQKLSSKRRGHLQPLYTRFEFEQWLFSHEDFEYLYLQWVESGFNKNVKPSVDRLDNTLPYSLDNIQLVTWQFNNNKGYSDMRKGLITVTSNPQKPVIQTTLKGEFIAEYPSSSEASRRTNALQSKISDVCRGKRKTAGGFKWQFKK